MEQGSDRFTLPIALLAALWALPAIASSTIAHLPNVQINAAKVDASGDIYLAGQTTNAGSAAAYIAKLSPNGTTLYAVTLGGSGSSTSAASVLDIDSAGSAYVAGTTTAGDFPVTAGAVQSPGATTFAAKLDANGDILYSALIGGSANTVPSSIVVNSSKELVVSGQSTTPPAGAVALFLLKLSADGTQVVAGPQGIKGAFPTSEGLGVVASQTPAPLLYVSEPQINFQAPYEIAGSPETNVTVTYPDVNGNSISDSRTLQVAASNPVAFLSQPSTIDQSFPLALNSDGTANSETNPAAAGSQVTIFLDGLGITNPPPITGQVNTAPSVPLSLPVVVTSDCSVVCSPVPAFISAGSVAGSISGVTQVQLLAPANPRPAFTFLTIFSLSVGPAAVRDMNLSLWVN